MTKRKKNRKKKTPQQAVSMKPERYIQKHARKSPIYECLIDVNWRQTQFSPVIVSRQKASGRLIVGMYIVDMQCLGVKDTAYYQDVEHFKYREFVQDMEESMGQHFVEIAPTLCFNIIYGAVEFAEDCGFQAHKDFAISEYVLEDVESIEYMKVPLGKDGKPFFIAGPFDNSEKIMATLLKNKGVGNFEFIAEINPEENMFIEDAAQTNTGLSSQITVWRKTGMKKNNRHLNNPCEISNSEYTNILSPPSICTHKPTTVDSKYDTRMGKFRNFRHQ